MEQIKKTLIENYSVDDEKFDVKAHGLIDNYIANMPQKGALKDPKRLGTKAVWMSTLRTTILDNMPTKKTNTTLDHLANLHEQIKVQIKSIKDGQNVDFHALKLMPDNLKNLKLTNTEQQELLKLKDTTNKEKLKAEPTTVNGDTMLTKVMPLLLTDKPMQVATALMLATGRRTIEVLKTASFDLDGDMKSDGYECMFSGQAKVGLNEDNRPYKIPLLAPFWMIQRAMKTLREKENTTALTNEEAHNKYNVNINTAVKKLCGVTPHTLRSVYAMMCHKLNPREGSMIGYIATILGHQQLQNAIYYQRINVENFTGAYVPTKADIDAVAVDKKEWKASTKPEVDRLAVIQAMMAQGKRITVSSVRKAGGGSLALIERLIEQNKELIDEHNAKL